MQPIPYARKARKNNTLVIATIFPKAILPVLMPYRESFCSTTLVSPVYNLAKHNPVNNRTSINPVEK